jgi:putative NADH-flavin reductase
MKLVLLGVTGDTGATLLQAALAHKHQVTAIARTPAKVAVTDAATLVVPLTGADAVISCVGVSNPQQARKGTTVYSVGTRHLVESMRKAGVLRLITVSSAGVAERKGAPLLYKLIVKPFFLEPAYQDMRLMEAFLTQQSDLEWTVVRPPYLTGDPLTTDYRLQADRNFDDDRPLPRRSLAHFLLTEAESPHFLRHVVAISG